MHDCSTLGEQRTDRQGTDNLDGCDIILCGILIVEYIVDLCQSPNGMYNTKRRPPVN